jgi:simple sugar transport system permease protein
MISPPRDTGGITLPLAVSVGVAAVVLALAGGVLAVTGTPIARGSMLIISGAFGSPEAIHETLARGGCVILTGLAAALAFRIKLYNFGTEGQMQAGALIAFGIGSVAATWPSWAILPLQLAIGAATGAAIMLGATFLRLRRGVDEGIVTLLANFVMMLIVDMELDGRQTAAAAANRLHLPLGLIIALAAAVLIAVATYVTVWGFTLRATAGNPEAARYAGIPIARVVFRVAALSGALAGLAGVCLVADTGSANHNGYGYAGIAVAFLARFSPVGSVIAGLFVAALMTGADSVPRFGSPEAFSDVLIALVLLVGLIGLAVRERLRTVRNAAP